MANPKIQLRHDTSTNWTSVNPVLLEGEVGVEITSQKDANVSFSSRDSNPLVVGVNGVVSNFLAQTSSIGTDAGNYIQFNQYPSGDYTWEVTFSIDTFGQQQVIIHQESAFNAEINPTGMLQGYNFTTSTATDLSQLEVNKKYTVKIVATNNGQDKTYYLNGEQVGTITGDTNVDLTDTYPNLGLSSYYHNGMLDNPLKGKIYLAETFFNDTPLFVYNKNFKIGDGATAWSDLDYQGTDTTDIEESIEQLEQDYGSLVDKVDELNTSINNKLDFNKINQPLTLQDNFSVVYTKTEQHSSGGHSFTDCKNPLNRSFKFGINTPPSSTTMDVLFTAYSSSDENLGNIVCSMDTRKNEIGFWDNTGKISGFPAATDVNNLNSKQVEIWIDTLGNFHIIVDSGDEITANSTETFKSIFSTISYIELQYVGGNFSASLTLDLYNSTNFLALSYDNNTLKVNDSGQLYADVSSEAPANMVTTDTEQTITGAKTIDTLTVQQISRTTTDGTYNLYDTSMNSTLSGLGMPSDNVINLSLGATGTSYTAPANGYVFVELIVNTLGELSANMNLDNSQYYGFSILNPLGSQYPLRLTLPVYKGKAFTVFYLNRISTNKFQFIYAQGEEVSQ